MIVVVVIVEHKEVNKLHSSPGSVSLNSTLRSGGVVLFESVFEWEKITPRLLQTLPEFNN
jgi:hypothetical protein